MNFKAAGVVFVLLISLSGVSFWLGGYDFNTREPHVGFIFFVVMVFGALFSLLISSIPKE
jgi:hypothetical protein